MNKCIGVLLGIVLAGCASTPPEHLTTYPLLDDRALLAAMSKQMHAVHDISGEGEIYLTQPNGEHVTLDMAIALHPASDARVRAWKFGQAIFDLTVTPQGVWLLSEDRHVGQLQITSAQLARSLSLLSGEILEEPGNEMHDDGDRLILTHHAAGEPTVRCTIDRPTRTIRRYELLDEQNVVRFSLTQSQFVEHDFIPWPQRIVAVSDRGTIDITLHDVDLNSGLPPNAFVPPHRASRLP